MQTEIKQDNGPPGYFELLKNFQDYRKLYFARTASLLGDWFNLIALLALLRETGHENPTITSTLFIAKLLPHFFAGFPAGVVADRFSRKRIMIISDIVRFIITLGLFVSILFPSNSALIVLVLTSLQVASSSFFEPARSASIPNLVPEKALVTANALDSVTWSLMYTLGISLGGIVTELLGWRPALFLDALTFLISAGLIFGAHIPQKFGASKDQKNDFLGIFGLRDLHSGYHYIKDRTGLVFLMLLKTGLCLAGSVSFVLTLYGQKVYHFGFGPDLGVAVLMACRALGTGLGPLIGRYFTKNNSERMRQAVRIAFFVNSFFYFCFAITTNSVLACLFVTLAHTGGSIVWVFSTVLIQKVAPDEFRGRIFAMELGLAMLVISTSIFIFGRFADIVGNNLFYLPLLLGIILLVPSFLWNHFGSKKRFNNYKT